MKRPTVTVTVELLPINPENLDEKDRTEERYLEIMKARCDNAINSGVPTLLVNQILWSSTMKVEFPDDWNMKDRG